jgi:trigger factor
MMQVTETLSDGLKRELKVVIGAQELGNRLNTKLEEIKTKVHLKGFRPGKAPLEHLRKMYGRSVMGEVVEQAVSETTSKTLTDRAERPAYQPAITFPEDQAVVEQVFQGKADLEFTVTFEVLPTIELVDLKTVSVDKPVAEISEETIETAMRKLAEANVTYETKDGPSESGNRMVVSFVGSIDGVPFEGGAAEDASVVLGSSGFIPGFEEGLTGAVAGEERTIKAQFPETYQTAELAGKEAEFAVTVKEVGTPVTPEINDEFAKTLGLTTVEELKNAIKGRIQSDYDNASRSKVKRLLLDALDAAHSFDLPLSLVEGEFNAMWKDSEAAPGEDEAAAEAAKEKNRARYQTLAERRVRLGLILAEIGTRNQIRVTDEDMRRAVMERARQFPGQEKLVVDYFKKNSEALAELQAPIFEDKVVDFTLELAQVNEKPVTVEELFAHEHGPDCDHDHDEVEAGETTKMEAAGE